VPVLTLRSTKSEVPGPFSVPTPATSQSSPTAPKEKAAMICCWRGRKARTGRCWCRASHIGFIGIAAEIAEGGNPPIRTDSAHRDGVSDRVVADVVELAVELLRISMSDSPGLLLKSPKPTTTKLARDL
jgi:hypothetical protein